MDNNVILEMTKEYSPVNRDAKLKGVMDKWSRTGLLNKLNEDKSSVVAQLLENQAVELRNTILNEESSLAISLVTTRLPSHSFVAFSVSY